MIDFKRLFQFCKFAFDHRNFTSNPVHSITINQVLNANRLYYNEFTSYEISDHLSVIKGIFTNLIKCDNDFINDIIVKDKYINHTIDFVARGNDFDSTCQLINLICSFKIPIHDSTFLNLFNNLLSHYTILSPTSSFQNNKLFCAVNNAIKHCINTNKFGKGVILPVEDKLLEQIYFKLKQIISTLNVLHIIHQSVIYDIDDICTNLLSSIHLLVKFGFDFDYTSVVNLFVSDGLTPLSTNTLISILYSLLDINKDYKQLYGEICIALNYRLFVMDKSEEDLLLQILYMHRITQKYRQIEFIDSRVKLLPQILRRRYDILYI